MYKSVLTTFVQGKAVFSELDITTPSFAMFLDDVLRAHGEKPNLVQVGASHSFRLPSTWTIKFSGNLVAGTSRSHTTFISSRIWLRQQKRATFRSVG